MGTNLMRFVKWYTRRRTKASLCTNQAETGSFASKVKVCADCHTCETPLWRRGPNGPKSLCNACGIKYRKRKKAAAKAEQVSVRGQEYNKVSLSDHEEMKKRQKEKQQKMMMLVYEQQKEEKQAARLLMALSTANNK